MKPFIIIVSVSLLLFLTGCATERIKDYQPASPSVSERTTQASGVEVALDPFVESSRTKEFFKIDAVANGIAILHVRVLNNTSNQTFLVEKKNFQLLRNGDRDLIGGKKIERSSPAEQIIGLVGTGGLLVGGALVSHATEVQRNFTSKEIGDQTLSPGENMDGFIYFAPVNHGEDWTRAAAVKIKLAETKTQRSIELKIPLSQ